MKALKDKQVKNNRKKISKKKKRLILALSALVLLVLAAGYTVFIAPLLEKEEWVYKETTVEKGTLTVGVTESGTLDYGITSVMYDLDLDVSDDEDEDEEETAVRYLEIEEVFAVLGQRLSAGDALLKFTEDSVHSVRRILQNALIEAKAEYNETEAEYNLSLLEAQANYDAKLIAENYADDIYKYGAASVDNSITALELQIQQCQKKVTSLEEKLTETREDYAEIAAEYNVAKAEYDAYKETHYENFVVYQTAYLNALTRYQNAKSAVEQAEQNLENNVDEIVSLQQELKLLQARKEIDALEVEEDYSETLISGANAEITYNAKLESLKAELDDAEEEKKKLEEKLEAFEAFVGEDGILYAQGEGIVTESDYETGDSLLQMGVLVSYAEPGNMTISVDVTQEDVVELTVGDKVQIAFTSYEGEVYEGSILSIDTTATSQNSNTVSYTTVIGVDGDTSKLYGGMVADITFVTEQKEDVLYVSRKAIVNENGKTYVYKDTILGGKELTEVVTGMSNGTSVEIISGLSEGDTVYIASRVSSEEEVKSTTGQESSTGAGTTDGFTMPDGMDMPNSMEMPGGDFGGFDTGGFGGFGNSGTTGNRPNGGSENGQRPGRN